MLIKLINQNGDTFLLETNYIHEVGPAGEDESTNSTIMTSIRTKEGQAAFSVMDTVEEIYEQILTREKTQNK